MMDKAEYWLLDAVVEAFCPLNWLLSENIGLVFNKPGHGLTLSELIRTLQHLFQNGNLIAERMEQHESVAPFVPMLTEIEAALVGKLDVVYGLTPQGGAQWEAFSKPQWSRYIDASYRTDPDEGEIIASERRLVERYLSLEPYVSGIVDLVGSQAWDVVVPWQATYWKTLPKGHRIQFRYRFAENAQHDPAKLAEWSRLLQWYTPFENS